MDFWLKSAPALAIFLLSGALYFQNAQKQTLEAEIHALESSLSACEALKEQAHALITAQNEALEELRLKSTPPPFTPPERIRKVFIKDTSCEARLRAYERLFNEL